MAEAGVTVTWSNIPGWFDWEFLYDEAVERAPKGAVLVELGVAFGRSLAYLARRAIDVKRDDLVIIGVDPWVDDWTTPTGWEESARPTWGGDHAEWARAQGGPFSAFLVAMRSEAPAELERVRILRATSREARGIFYGRFPWMVFIDADHRYEAVCADIRAYRPLVSPVDGILAGHDYSPEFPGVVRAVDELVPERTITGTTWRGKGKVYG